LVTPLESPGLYNATAHTGQAAGFSAGVNKILLHFKFGINLVWYIMIDGLNRETFLLLSLTL
jgi:hypothetical protein